MINIDKMNLNQLLDLEDKTENEFLKMKIKIRVEKILKMMDRYFFLTGEILEGGNI